MPGNQITSAFHVLSENLPSHIGKIKRRRVTLFVGTDRDIGRTKEEMAVERRVGITPDQAVALREALEGAGVTLTTLVHEGAGTRAGYSDHDYIHAGCEIVGLNEIPFIHPVPDVVHALKEPSLYEATFAAGPFMRIGALHAVGDFKIDGGFHRLAKRKNVAVFDGSNIGASALHRIPIRGAMSVFAGRIAAEWVFDSSQEGSTAVVVGGGYAGRAAIREFLRRDPEMRVVVFDINNEVRLADIRNAFDGYERVHVKHITRDRDCPKVLTEAAKSRGLVLCVAVAGMKAPKLFSVNALKNAMSAARGVVVDIAIDEGGTVACDGPGWENATHETIIPHLTDALNPVQYRAVANMPRERAKDASIEHGRRVLPYLLALLILSARTRDLQEAVQEILKYDVDTTSNNPELLSGPAQLAALVQDLRNGMAVWPSLDGRGDICTGKFLPREVLDQLIPNSIS